MLKKLPSNLFKIFLLTGFLLTGSLSFSQEPEAPPPAENNQVVEEHDTKDLEALLKRYNKDSEKVLEDSSKIHNIEAGTTTTEVQDADLEEMRPSDTLAKAKETSIERMKDAQAEKKRKALMASTELSDSVRLALEPLQSLSEEELLKRLKEATKDSPMRAYMESNPKIPLVTVRLIKDKESVPSLVKIVEDKQRLIYFGSAMLFSILFGFMLKKVMHREGRSFLKACFYFLIRMQIMFAVRIGIIYYFYRVEFTPAAKIFKETFF